MKLCHMCCSECQFYSLLNYEKTEKLSSKFSEAFIFPVKQRFESTSTFTWFSGINAGFNPLQWLFGAVALQCELMWVQLIGEEDSHLWGWMSFVQKLVGLQLPGSILWLFWGDGCVPSLDKGSESESFGSWNILRDIISGTLHFLALRIS